MVEQSKETDNSRQELDLSFLKDLPENQLMDINGAAHLVNHFWEHRRIPGLNLSEMATVLKSTENQVTIARKIIGELERAGSCPFKNLPQDLINKGFVEVSIIWSKKFEKNNFRPSRQSSKCTSVT